MDRKGHGIVAWYMRVWAEWWSQRREYGWPRCSHEERARRQALVPHRPEPGPRIPDIDRARVGPMVDRLLLDLDYIFPELGGAGPGGAMRAEALASTHAHAARELGLSVRTFRRRLEAGKLYIYAAVQRRRMRDEGCEKVGGQDDEAYQRIGAG